MNRTEIRGFLLELRIKLEKTLQHICDMEGVSATGMMPKQILNLLLENRVIDRSIYDIAFNILQLGNRAAHHDVSQVDYRTAEKLESRLEMMLLEQGLIFEKKKKEEPTFRELFERSEGISSRKSAKREEKDFSTLLEEFDNEMAGKFAPPPVDREPQKRIDTKKLASRFKGNNCSAGKESGNDFSNLLDEFMDMEEFDK